MSDTDLVDVNECGFYHPEYDNYCHIALAFSEEYSECLQCKDNPDCYYKQLMRARVEIEELKAENEELQALLNNITVQSNNEITAYKTECEQIKKDYAKLHIDFAKCNEENVELKAGNKKMYQSMHKEICEIDEELELEKASHKDDLRTLKQYSQCLKEIQKITDKMLKGVSDNCIKTTPFFKEFNKIQDKINEVIQ